MPSMSKTIKELDRIVAVFSDALKLLREQEEQKQKVLDLIEKEQDGIIGSTSMPSWTEYKKGKFDGLNVAYGIVEDELEVGEQE